MKKLLLFVLAATALAACSTDPTQDLAPEIPTAPDELQVSFDEEDTRIQLGENGRPVWTKGDLISVFYRSNANSKYQFVGETGDAKGSIELVEEGVATQQTTQIVAVYPYSEDYWFNWNTGDVEAFLPAEQTYLKDSFGIGSSIMVSKSDYKQLSFKNVCGWIKLQFTGTGSISKIVLKGNDGEQVAGEIYINTQNATCALASDMGESGEDSMGGNIITDNTILTSVTLNCGEYGVQLDKNTPTAFYIALPPQTFEKGFTATMYGCDGSTKEISTNKTITIERNHILPMASATLEMPIPSNQIWYTSSDGNIVEPYATDVFGANITSNTYENGVGVITFDGDVTMIGKDAFENCSALTSVTIGNGVTEIGSDAFWGCDALTSVTIGNSVTTIGGSAFGACYALTSVTIPDSVTTIGSRAFECCSALTSVTIPDSVTTIGSGAFAPCNALKAFYGKFASADNRCLIVDGVLNSFAPAGLTTYSIPDSVTTIGEYAFENCDALTSVTIPDSVTTIGEYAFNSCSALTSVTIGNSVTTIGDSAFYDCDALTSVTIPDSVTTIGDSAFRDCDALTSVTIPDSVTTIGNYAFYGCDALTSVTIPDSVTTIGERAFYSCDALSSVTIGNSVTTIGERAFYSCDALTSVTIGNSVTTIGERAFYNCDALKTFYGKFASKDNRCLIVDGVLNSFAPAGLTEYTIPDSVTTIGSYAFYSCDALSSVTIPDSVTTIGDYAFCDCSTLKEVYCEPTTPPSLGGSNVFDGNASDRKIYVYTESVNLYKATSDWNDYADSIYSMGNYPANGETTIILYTTSDEQLIATSTFPIKSNTYQNGVGEMVIYGTQQTIPEYAFKGYTTLTSITIPDSVMTIERYAFYGCTALTSVTIPDSVTTIGNSAFRYCSALTSVTIPDSVTKIGGYAFDSCSALKAFYGKFASADNRCLIVDGVLNYFAPAGLTTYSIPDSVTTIGSKAFRDCDALTSVTIGNSVTTIGSSAFEYCSALTSVTIPNSVTSIGTYAFTLCHALTSVTIGDSVTTIGIFAFYSCSSLKEVYCKPTTPPSLGNSYVFDSNASGRKIYVPTASVDAYKSKQYWSEYADAIEPYNFTE